MHVTGPQDFSSAQDRSRLTGPCLEALQCSLVISRAKLYHMCSSKVVAPVQLCVVAWRLAEGVVGQVSVNFRRQIDRISGRIRWLYLDTKLVLSCDSSLSLSEPPTICLTLPECKSMQGRKALRLWEVMKGNEGWRKTTGKKN